MSKVALTNFTYNADPPNSHWRREAGDWAGDRAGEWRENGDSALVMMAVAAAPSQVCSITTGISRHGPDSSTNQTSDS